MFDVDESLLCKNMNNRIPSEHVKNTCKIGQGANCCRYLIFIPRFGYCCAKLDEPLKIHLDNRVKSLTSPMFAEGDNCEGKPANTSI